MLINEKKIIKTVHNGYGVCKNNKETNKQTLKILLKIFLPDIHLRKKRTFSLSDDPQLMVSFHLASPSV